MCTEQKNSFSTCKIHLFLLLLLLLLLLYLPLSFLLLLLLRLSFVFYLFRLHFWQCNFSHFIKFKMVEVAPGDGGCNNRISFELFDMKSNVALATAAAVVVLLLNLCFRHLVSACFHSLQLTAACCCCYCCTYQAWKLLIHSTLILLMLTHTYWNMPVCVVRTYIIKYHISMRL